MAKLERPHGLKINFKPSERQYELWKALQPGVCECGGKIEMRPSGVDEKGHTVYKAMCTKCGTTDIPEQILGGGSAGGGKAQMLDSQILTPFGYRFLRDIKNGDLITSATTGGVQRVVYLHPIGDFDFYRVKFRDGTCIDCSEGHLWQLHESRKHKSKKSQKYGVTDEVVWPAIKMYEWYQKKKSGMYKGQYLIIPLTEPVKFTFGDKGNYYIDPYILGAIIGDGSITDKIIEKRYVQFTTMDDEIVDRFKLLGYDMSHNFKTKGRAYTYRISDKTLIECLKKHGIAGNCSQTHFIPKVYKFSTIEERIKLMQGLMDTDGYVDNRGHMSYTTTSKQLADDVAFVVRSLGGMATITSDTGKYRNGYGEIVECSEVWTVYFRTKMDPDLCGLTRKKERAKYEFNGGNSEYGKRIVDVEYLGKREGRCISVSEPSGLYVTNDFTVTHNSYLGCCWLVYSCIKFSGIRMLVARKVRKTLIETTWKTLKDVLKGWGLVESVNYSINSQLYEITFWNGSTISAIDLTPLPSDPSFDSLGSLEITGAFVDEVSEVSEKAIEVLASRIRYKIEDTFIVGKILMTCNPTVNWPRKTFVMDDDGNPAKLLPGYRYMPFSLFDNPNEKFRMIYYNKLKKIRDKATRDRLLYGNWWFVESNSMAAYWNFDGDKHLKQGLFESRYDPLLPLILSFDFNVNPYMTCLPMQFDYENKKVYVLSEFIGSAKDKLNNTPAFTRWVANELLKWGHVGGVLITGDPAGLARSTQTEDGTNNFTIASKNFTEANLNPKIQLLSKQPAQITRLEFVNELFTGYDGWSIEIDIRCHRLTEDFIYQKKNPDGTKEKKKVLTETGERAEKYGHASDCFDYSIAYYLSSTYERYKSSSTSVVTTISPDEVMYDGFEF